jgi:magnesium-transporting ATPase (P-type)
MAFSGTLVVSGQGMVRALLCHHTTVRYFMLLLQGVLIATGDAAEIGKIQALVAGVKPTVTPLVAQLETFGRWVSVLCVCVSVFYLLHSVGGPRQLTRRRLPCRGLVGCGSHARQVACHSVLSLTLD